MSNEWLGIADSLEASRKIIAARLSPGARHAAFPALYARPIPSTPQVLADERVAKLEKKIKALETWNTELLAENGRLKERIDILTKRQKDERQSEFVEGTFGEDVIEAFCDALNRRGFRVGDQPWTIFMMRSAKRSLDIAHPRMICMWTVFKVCPHLTLPHIGRLFGKDHTTVMHARARAGDILRQRSDLAEIAFEVADRFRIVKETTGNTEAKPHEHPRSRFASKIKENQNARVSQGSSKDRN